MIAPIRPWLPNGSPTRYNRVGSDSQIGRRQRRPFTSLDSHSVDWPKNLPCGAVVDHLLIDVVVHELKTEYGPEDRRYQVDQRGCGEERWPSGRPRSLHHSTLDGPAVNIDSSSENPSSSSIPGRPGGFFPPAAGRKWQGDRYDSVGHRGFSPHAQPPQRGESRDGAWSRRSLSPCRSSAASLELPPSSANESAFSSALIASSNRPAPA